MSESRINHSGLFRCCLLTWHERHERGDLPTDEGDVMQCTYCDEFMVLEDGVWRWADA